MATDELAGGSSSASVRGVAPAEAFFGRVTPMSTMGIGSLPHRDLDRGARFADVAFDVLTLPSLPRRSPAEAPVAQALAGTDGISIGQYGAVCVDVDRLDVDAAAASDTVRDEYGGLRAALAVAAERGHTGPVKWQFVGPISVGVTLRRAGVPAPAAFDLAGRIVRRHLVELADVVGAILPASPQLVVLDEPLLDGVLDRSFPIAPDEAVDLLSSTLAVVQRGAAVGIHTCGEIDVATLLAAGPDLISIPARPRLVDGAGYLARFVQRGGWVAWGAVTTEGPIGGQPARVVRELTGLWRELAERGVDAAALRRQALITPQCGLGGHGTAVASEVVELTQRVAEALAAR